RDPDGGTTTDLATATATIDLDAGETVYCSFVDARGRSALDTRAEANSAEHVAFVGDLCGFALDNNADPTLPTSRSFAALAAGSSPVPQLSPPGPYTTLFRSRDPDGGTTTDLATATATIDLDAGETVRCSFVDTRQ